MKRLSIHGPTRRLAALTNFSFLFPKSLLLGASTQMPFLYFVDIPFHTPLSCNDLFSFPKMDSSQSALHFMARGTYGSRSPTVHRSRHLARPPAMTLGFFLSFQPNPGLQP